jgi:hypothetical protein
MMPKKPTANVTPMIHQIAKAIANADGADLNADPTRYRRLALAALKPLVNPTETMIDAAHGAVWSDGLGRSTTGVIFRRRFEQWLRWR